MYSEVAGATRATYFWCSWILTILSRQVCAMAFSLDADVCAIESVIGEGFADEFEGSNNLMHSEEPHLR